MTQITVPFTPFTPRGDMAATRNGQEKGMFFLFSNRLGCLGSLLVSAAATAVLLLVLNR